MGLYMLVRKRQKTEKLKTKVRSMVNKDFFCESSSFFHPPLTASFSWLLLKNKKISWWILMLCKNGSVHVSEKETKNRETKKKDDLVLLHLVFIIPCDNFILPHLTYFSGLGNQLMQRRNLS